MGLLLEQVISDIIVKFIIYLFILSKSKKHQGEYLNSPTNSCWLSIPRSSQDRFYGNNRREEIFHPHPSPLPLRERGKIV